MYYFEDFQPGKRFDLGSKTLSEEEIIAFAKAYDPQPFHSSPAEAEKSPFGGIIASGMQTLAVFTRLLVDTLLNHATGMGSPGCDELRWPNPVRPGDTLTASVTVIASIPSKSRPTMGIVRLKWEMTNQKNEPVLNMTNVQFLGRKPQE